MQLFPYWEKAKKDRLIEGNVKCRHLYNWPVKGLCGKCFSVWCPEPYIPPLHNVYAYTVNLHRKGGSEPERRLEGRHNSQSWVENTNMIHSSLYLQPLIAICDLYGPVCNAFDPVKSITRSNERGSGPGNQAFMGLCNSIEPLGECHLGPKSAVNLNQKTY